jgi:hypothetical protein
MKLRPSEEVWDKLDELLNQEEKNNGTIGFNRLIVAFGFMVLIYFGILLLID